jgi:hypothetical protein
MLVKNRSWSPRILTLPGGKKGKPKTLSLRGRGSAEITKEEYESPECQRLIARGELFVIPGDAPRSEPAAGKTTKSKKAKKTETKKGAEADA